MASKTGYRVHGVLRNCRIHCGADSIGRYQHTENLVFPLLASCGLPPTPPLGQPIIHSPDIVLVGKDDDGPSMGGLQETANDLIELSRLGLPRYLDRLGHAHSPCGRTRHGTFRHAFEPAGPTQAPFRGIPNCWGGKEGSLLGPTCLRSTHLWKRLDPGNGQTSAPPPVRDWSIWDLHCNCLCGMPVVYNPRKPAKDQREAI